MQLTDEEARVIGSLIEKQLTTPQQYPLTLNALLLACNQSSNREPVVDYDERTVDNALVSLKAAGLLRFVHPSHGRSVARYEQLLQEKLAISTQQLALVGVLLLRGPQTGGELRSRTERMAQFDGIAQVESELQRLSTLPEPVVARLPRRPGQKEERWQQLLVDCSAGVLSDTAALPVPSLPSQDEPGAFGRAYDLVAEVAELRGEMGELRAEVTSLRDQVEKLRRDLYE